jgi:outer membrane immunogenic protein
MRRVMWGLLSVLFVSEAIAADYPEYLRGSTYDAPPVRYNWTGAYFGGQIGYANADFDFTKATRPLVAEMARGLLVETEGRISELPFLPRRDGRGTTYGGFIGYNWQWGEAVLGVEGNYNHTSISSASTDSIARGIGTTDGSSYSVSIDSQASARLTDYATLRGRAGWAVGWIMPYVQLGIAMGRVDYSRRADLTIRQFDPDTGAQTGQLIDFRSETKTGAYTFGYTTGFGVDIGLFPGVFVRGEYEFVQLLAVGGIPIHLNTFRAAAAVKF